MIKLHKRMRMKIDKLGADVLALAIVTRPGSGHTRQVKKVSNAWIALDKALKDLDKAIESD